MCSWNSHSDLKMRRAVPAPRKAWRVGRPTALSIKSAIASVGTRSDTRRWRSSARGTDPASRQNLTPFGSEANTPHGVMR